MLSAAHLYEGLYLWAKVYSPQQLFAAAAQVDRLVYLESLKEELPRWASFCKIAEQTVHLGVEPRRPSAEGVRVTEVQRC